MWIVEQQIPRMQRDGERLARHRRRRIQRRQRRLLRLVQRGFQDRLAVVTADEGAARGTEHRQRQRRFSAAERKRLLSAAARKRLLSAAARRRLRHALVRQRLVQRGQGGAV